ncbi:hypothetical protein M413DRAFT_23471 [Hebeloma cylindrosporum]|uniref:Uncharacterized protein n=1 Tax=Hebeloma cylindrosporum TaxID=76867 RepID=A0A0C2YBN0_HEBCY|nr:hypothetical protein M413DRAFT_23471 [Hebeloma cylindrosporum h7]
MAPLAPGDYVWNVTCRPSFIDLIRLWYQPLQSAAERYIRPFEEVWHGVTVEGGSRETRTTGPHGKISTMSSSLEQFVTTRDRGRCLITGSSSNVTEISVSWIFPPAWAQRVQLTDDQHYGQHSAISNPSNAMLVRKDLIAASHDNAFGRLSTVIFRDIGPAQYLLTGSTSQAYVRRRGTKVQLFGADDYFLREHFKHCLRFHMLHGDIHVDYPQGVIVQALTDLGLWERDDEEAPLSDPRWNTELGKAIFACHTLQQL